MAPWDHPLDPPLFTVFNCFSFSSLQGVTLRLMGEKLVIARIMYGGLIHRQGLLKVGDVVKEVNGEVVSSMQPVELQSMLVRMCVELKALFVVDE